MKLTLPLAPSANLMWRSVAGARKDKLYKAVKGGVWREIMQAIYVNVTLSKAGRQFKKDAAVWLQAQRTEILTGDLFVKITVWFPNRRGDLDNRIKPVLDVLQGVAYTNDSQIVHLVVGREVSEKPRTVVVISPVELDLFSPDEDDFAHDLEF